MQLIKMFYTSSNGKGKLAATEAIKSAITNNSLRKLSPLCPESHPHSLGPVVVGEAGLAPGLQNWHSM